MSNMLKTIVLLFTLCTGAVNAQDLRFAATLDGSQEVPSVSSPALGYGTVTLNSAETEIAVKLFFSGLNSNQTMGHIHGSATTGQQGSNTGVIFNIGSSGALTGTFNLTFSPTSAQVQDLRAGRWYFNVHSANNGSGEIRGQILPELDYHAVLLPIHEVPAVTNAPTASGYGLVRVNDSNTGISASVFFEGLSANQTAAHIHSSAGVAANGSVLFNIGSQSSTSGAFLDLPFALTDEQQSLLRAGRLYFNVHTGNNPGGEVRGQILRGRPIIARLQGAQEVPPVITNASGFGFVQFNGSETALLASALYAGLSSPATVAHIHTGESGVNGPATFNMTPIGTFVGATAGFAPYASFAASVAQIASLKAGGTYFNVHSSNNSGGEIRGQIDGVFSDGFDRRAFQSIAGADVINLRQAPVATLEGKSAATAAMNCPHAKAAIAEQANRTAKN